MKAETYLNNFIEFLFFYCEINKRRYRVNGINFFLSYFAYNTIKQWNNNDLDDLIKKNKRFKI